MAHVFFSDDDKLPNPIARLTDYGLARDRIWKAIKEGERITVYGDYDVDGQTSVVLMWDMLRAAGASNPRVFVPDRVEDDYGLTISGTSKCIESHAPSLIISVDCGSPSIPVIEDLKSKGVDTIVIDHHGVPPYEGRHPAYAHLNPKDPYANGTDELRAMSAAGLVYFFVDAFVSEMGVQGWDRNRAIILGGVGTLVDVMPLTGLNRSLVKASLALANRGDLFTRLPGLDMLREECGIPEINSWAYGFIFGPHLNATGRVATARSSISLLAARTRERAGEHVREAILRNTERKSIQKVVQEEAERQAAEQLSRFPDRRILILADKGWHPGVVGIVAGRIKEATLRPVFVCGWNSDDCYWKGSGRSVPGVELGELVFRARDAGVLLGGGGHAMAAGIKIPEDGLQRLIDWVDNETKDVQLDFARHYEILGEADLFPVHQWHDIYRDLEPFGNGNQRPHLWMSRAQLLDAPRVMTRKADGEPWAMKGRFRGAKGGEIVVTWKDYETARAVWEPGKEYLMVLSLTRTSSRGQTYDNIDVQHCQPL